MVDFVILGVSVFILLIVFIHDEIVKPSDSLILKFTRWWKSGE